MITERLQTRTFIDVPEINQSDFRLEYGENAPDQALVNDVISYLGEYRFNLPKFSYTLKFSDGKLRDPHRGDSMQDITQRAIDKKNSEGKSYSRELAEKLGFVSLDAQLMSAKDNDTVVWASPPGPKEEGYGDYGFIFIGHVNTNSESEKIIRMTALRLEHPAIEQFNKALSLILEEKIENKTPEEFLRKPGVKKGKLQEEYADSILGMFFSFKPNPQEQAKFRLIIQKMFPLISDFVQSAKNPWKVRSEKIKELYSLENYALKLKNEYEQQLISGENVVIDFKPSPRLPDIVGVYGHEPPKATGSCPANTNNKKSEFTSSNIFSKGSFLDNLVKNQEWFNCPKCGYQADGPIGDTCPGCELTKAEYAQETGINCD